MTHDYIASNSYVEELHVRSPYAGTVHFLADSEYGWRFAGLSEGPVIPRSNSNSFSLYSGSALPEEVVFRPVFEERPFHTFDCRVKSVGGNGAEGSPCSGRVVRRTELQGSRYYPPSGEYQENTLFRGVALPNLAHTFAKWDCVGGHVDADGDPIKDSMKNPLPIKMYDDIGVVALFRPCQLTLMCDPPDGGTVTSAWSTTECGKMTIGAQANPGYSFAGWSGDFSGSDNPATLTMDKDKAVIAHMSLLPRELDIRETAQPQNRIGRDDPRILQRVRNRILVWANSGANTITFDLIKPPDIAGPVWIQIEDRKELNSGMPHFERLDAESVTFTYTVPDDNDDADLIVFYGSDLNADGTLSPTGEIKGRYYVYGVTAEDYAESKNNYGAYLGGLTYMADQLHRRFAYGAFKVPTWLENDYRPTSTSGSATLSADRFTHDFGANFADAGFVGIAGRQYYAATVTLPIYHYADNSTGSDLTRESKGLKVGLDKFASQLSYATIATAYAAASGGATRSVTLSLDGAQFQFGGTGSIGLGGVSVNSAEPYSSIGTITLEVTLNGCNYEVGTDAVIDLTLHDVFDFDYFTPQNFDESRSAAMIQSGFGKTGSVANAGQVGLVEVEVHGDVKITERTITP